MFGCHVEADSLAAVPNSYGQTAPGVPNSGTSRITRSFSSICTSRVRLRAAPPAPFTLSELDPAGIPPDRVYTKDELAAYLRYCRQKCRAMIEGLTDEAAQRRCVFAWLDLGFAELLLYSMRHVQHHAGQLNRILRQRTDAAPRWVFQAQTGDNA